MPTLPPTTAVIASHTTNIYSNNSNNSSSNSNSSRRRQALIAGLSIRVNIKCLMYRIRIKAGIMIIIMILLMVTAGRSRTNNEPTTQISHYVWHTSALFATVLQGLNRRINCVTMYNYI